MADKIIRMSHDIEHNGLNLDVSGKVPLHCIISEKVKQCLDNGVNAFLTRKKKSNDEETSY